MPFVDMCPLGRMKISGFNSFIRVCTNDVSDGIDFVALKPDITMDRGFGSECTMNKKNHILIVVVLFVMLSAWNISNATEFK